MKKSLKKLCIFMVSLMALVVLFSGCTPKKDLTGKWNLKNVSIYGFSLNAATANPPSSATPGFI